MGKELFGFNTDNGWDYENGFYLTSHVTRVAKMLAQYELYKSILHLPGHIVECGVFKGASLIRLATFREVLESPYSRKIIGFDAFGEFPCPADSLDAVFVRQFERAAGRGISIEELREVLTHKGFSNIELIPGDVLVTVPQYLQVHPELKISVLHLDVDVYQASKLILDCLYDRVVKGGVVVFDDYGTVAGETRAIDEFCQGDITVQKLSISHIPSYIRK